MIITAIRNLATAAALAVVTAGAAEPAWLDTCAAFRARQVRTAAIILVHCETAAQAAYDADDLAAWDRWCYRARQARHTIKLNAWAITRAVSARSAQVWA